MAKLQERLMTVQDKIQKIQEQLIIRRNEIPQLEASLFAHQGQVVLLQEMITEEAAQAEAAAKVKAELESVPAVEDPPVDQAVNS